MNQSHIMSQLADLIRKIWMAVKPFAVLALTGILFIICLFAFSYLLLFIIIICLIGYSLYQFRNLFSRKPQKPRGHLGRIIDYDEINKDS